MGKRSSSQSSPANSLPRPCNQAWVSLLTLASSRFAKEAADVGVLLALSHVQRHSNSKGDNTG